MLLRSFWALNFVLLRSRSRAPEFFAFFDFSLSFLRSYICARNIVPVRLLYTYMAKKGQKRTGRTEQAEQDIQNRTGRTVQAE